MKSKHLPIVRRGRNIASAMMLLALTGCFLAGPGLREAGAQSDPTTNRPVFHEPPVIIPSLRQGAPVRLRAVYDDRGQQLLRRNIDGSTEVFNDSAIRQSYNRLFPSETLRVDPGAPLRVLLVNDLAFTEQDVENAPGILNRNDPPATRAFIISQRNITNLHVHGLHVSPQGLADNVLLHVNDGKRVTYDIPLPQDHAPGTHWYHSHVHGSTAFQVQNGMLGALIVNETSGQNLTPSKYIPFTEERLVILTQGSSNIINPREEVKLVTRKVADDLEPEIAKLLAKQTALRESSGVTEQLKKLIAVENEQQLDALVAELNEQGRLDELLEALNDLRQQPTFMVNGLLNPVTELVPGDIVRLRIINAGANNLDYKNVYVQNHRMYMAAMDGINLTHLPKDGAGNYIAYDQANPLALATANRADVYFIAGDVGSYSLMINRAGPLSNPQELMTFEISRPDFRRRPVAKDAYENTLQEFLNALDENLRRLQTIGAYAEGGYLHKFDMTEPPDAKRTVVFNVGGRGGPARPNDPLRKFTINGRDYNEIVDGEMQGMHDYLGKNPVDGGKGPDGTSPWPIREGTVEEWVIKNTTPNTYAPTRSGGRHPFHIHVNPFWVVDMTENGNSVRANNPHDPRLNRWQDTINIPGQESVTIRHRFDKYTGLFVLHCHILNHEDRGMMINVLIVPNQEMDPQKYFDDQMRENKRLNDIINR